MTSSATRVVLELTFFKLLGPLQSIVTPLLLEFNVHLSIIRYNTEWPLNLKCLNVLVHAKAQKRMIVFIIYNLLNQKKLIQII